MDVEEGKKENRSLGMWEWSLKKFLERYQEEDVYMINSLPKEIRGFVYVFLIGKYISYVRKVVSLREAMV